MADVILSDLISGKAYVSSIAAAPAAVALDTSTPTEVFVLRGLSGRKGRAVAEMRIATQSLASLIITATTVAGKHVSGVYNASSTVPVSISGDLASFSSVIDFFAPLPVFPIAAGDFLFGFLVDGLEEVACYGTTSVSGGTLQLIGLNVPRAPK